MLALLTPTLAFLWQLSPLNLSTQLVPLPSDLPLCHTKVVAFASTSAAPRSFALKCIQQSHPGHTASHARVDPINPHTVPVADGQPIHKMGCKMLQEPTPSLLLQHGLTKIHWFISELCTFGTQRTPHKVTPSRLGDVHNIPNTQKEEEEKKTGNYKNVRRQWNTLQMKTR